MTIEENLEPEISEELIKKVNDAAKGPRATPKSRPGKPEAAAPAKPEAPRAPYAVVGGGQKDTVLASVDEGSGKSLSVHHIQRRLAERGYSSVFRDRDGFWREGTTDALNEFVDAQKLDGKDRLAVLTNLFENDDNVEVVEEA